MSTDLIPSTVVDLSSIEADEKGFDEEVKEEEENVVFTGTIDLIINDGKSDNKTYLNIDKNLLAMSKFIKKFMIEEPESTSIILRQEIRPDVMDMVLEHMTHYFKATEDNKHVFVDYPLPSKALNEILSPYSYEFVQKCFAKKNDPSDTTPGHKFYHLILTISDYLKYGALYNDLVVGYAKFLIDNSAPSNHDKIREFTGQPDDLTPERKKQIREEDPW